MVNIYIVMYFRWLESHPDKVEVISSNLIMTTNGSDATAALFTCNEVGFGSTPTVSTEK